MIKVNLTVPDEVFITINGQRHYLWRAMATRFTTWNEITGTATAA